METLPGYDQVPYHSVPTPDCHIERLATVARLFGLAPRPVGEARVLELGCSDGGNLAPMAWNLPRSEFVGVDLSREQVEAGRQLTGALKIDNLHLEHAGIDDVDQDYGRFDYIICQGVYSWVPENIQDRILDVLAQNLTVDGIAYLDYNTYPGWHVLEPMRDLARYHADGIGDPKESVGQAMAVLDLLKNFVSGENPEYVALVRRETERIAKAARSMDGGAYIFHEYLEQDNRPVYFHQLARKLEHYGLEYIGETTYAQMLTHGFPPETAEVLGGIGDDIVRLEQYMDFLRNRRFRKSIIHRRGMPVDRNIVPERISGLRISTYAKLTKEVLMQNVPAGTVRDIALYLISQYPRALEVDSLLDEAAPPDNPAARRILAEDLIRLHANGAVQFHCYQAPFETEPGQRPQVSPVASFQAARGQGWLSSQAHYPAVLPGPLLELARRLDGRTRNELVEELKNDIEQGRLVIQDMTPTTENLARVLDQMLGQIASHALLVPVGN